jgi:microcystin-dependent protein
MPPMVGQISIFPYSFAPRGWMFCDGTALPIAENETLFQLIGFTYGGDRESTFALPNLTKAAPPNLHYAMSLFGIFNTGNMLYGGLLGETMLAVPALAAKNLMPAAGQSLLKSSYAVLEIYIGTRFGGDAQHFSLPDLRSKAPGGFQYLFAVQGDLPDNLHQRSPFLGEIFLLPYQQNIQTMLVCNGASLPIAQNPALYNLIGTTFGGSSTNFNLPNLTSAAPQGYTYYMAVKDVVFPPRS